MLTEDLNDCIQALASYKKEFRILKDEINKLSMQLEVNQRESYTVSKRIDTLIAQEVEKICTKN